MGATFSKREASVLAAAAMTVAATGTVFLSRLTLDDAYITFRYARHLAEGYGLGAWNHTGDRVEGYSSLLWTLLLAGVARLGVDVRLASKVFGRCGGACRHCRARPAPRRSPRLACGSSSSRCMGRSCCTPRRVWRPWRSPVSSRLRWSVQPRGSRSSRRFSSRCGPRACSSRVSTCWRSPGGASAGDGSSRRRLSALWRLRRSRFTAGRRITRSRQTPTTRRWRAVALDT